MAALEPLNLGWERQLWRRVRNGGSWEERYVARICPRALMPRKRHQGIDLQTRPAQPLCAAKVG